MVEKWNLMNPEGNEWNTLYINITKTTQEAKEILRWPITIRFTNLFGCPKQWKYRMQGQQWIKNGRSSKRPQHGNWRKSRARIRVVLDAQRDKKVHFATLMDICHLEHAELEPKLQMYKRRVVLRGDIVKDDSGASAALHEQGSAASPHDCCKSNGCCCKITRLRRTNRWCSIRVHSSLTGGRSQIAQNSSLTMSRRMDSSSTTQLARIMGKQWKSSGTFRTKLVTDTHLQCCCGKASLKKLYCGENYRIGNVFLSIETKCFLIGVRGWHQNG